MKEPPWAERGCDAALAVGAAVELNARTPSSNDSISHQAIVAYQSEKKVGDNGVLKYTQACCISRDQIK